MHVDLCEKRNLPKCLALLPEISTIMNKIIMNSKYLVNDNIRFACYKDKRLDSVCLIFLRDDIFILDNF